MNKTRNNKSRNNKYVLSMNDEITFHKPKNDRPNENDVTQIKNIFPELDSKTIIKSLKQHNFNIETTIEDLLSERFIKQNMSESDIKRNNKILEIYQNGTNDNSQEIVINGNNGVVVNDLTYENIDIGSGSEVNRNSSSNKYYKNNRKNNENNINVTKEVSDTSTSNEFLKKNKNRKKSSNENVGPNTQEKDNDVVPMIPGQTYKKTEENLKLLQTHNKSNDSSSSNRKNRNKNRKANQRKNSQNQSPLEPNESSDDHQSNNSVVNFQNYFKLSEVRKIFPDISERLLILTLQVNHGDIDKVVDFLLMQNSIKDEINEEDLCRSLELQLNNEHGLPTSCDGNCINQGYPCILHSRLILTKNDEYNTLNLSEIMKIWNQYELRDSNVSIGFIDNNQAIKYYTQDNDEIEFLILNRIKEAELAMTTEERNHQDDVEYFRDREAKLKSREHSFFNEANKKYRSGGITGFSSAAYYSQEGRKLEEEIEKVKLLAIRAQIKTNERNYMQNNGLTSFCGVDLHGLRVKEALPYLKDMLAIWKIEVMKHNPKYNKERSRRAVKSVIHTTTETYDFNASNVKSFSKMVTSSPKQKEETLHNLKINKVETLQKKKIRRIYPSVFNIITGKGLHSDANIGARLRPTITSYLKANKFNFVEMNPGNFEVRL